MVLGFNPQLRFRGTPLLAVEVVRDFVPFQG
jgi:hypothetical protein